MEGEWKLVRLGDHVDSCLGKMLDKNKNRGTLHPYLGNKNVRWGRFELQNLSQMKFQEDEHDRYGLLSGDLTVCEGGEPGRCAIWKNEVSGMKIQKALHRIRPLDGLNNIYLYYWFVFSANNGLLDPFFTGTTIKHLTGKSLADLQLPLPPLSEQKRIAYILGSLDDKIELNRQMNATLEGMAQALFKSWFVDFDPVIDNALAAGNPIPEAFSARAETRRKALAHGTANRDVAKQFPAAFQFTDEIGWIPEGWEVKKLRTLASKISKGTTPRKKEIEEASDSEIIPFLKVRDISDDGNIKDNLDLIPRSIHEKNLKRSILHFGDVLFSIAGTIGRVTIVPSELNNSNINQAIAFIRPNKLSHSMFILEHLKGSFVQDRIHSRVVQAVQANISLTELGDIPTVRPSSIIHDVWQVNSSQLYQKIIIMKRINHTLTNLRDTLLPKLISGEIRIPEAEKITEEALA